jgi:hypothetical protein
MAPLPFLVVTGVIFEVRLRANHALCAGNPADIGALSKAKPARPYHLARRGRARSLQFAQPGTPAFPRSCSFPLTSHSLPITSCRADGCGPIESTCIWRRRSWRLPRNPILGTDQTSQAFEVGLQVLRGEKRIVQRPGFPR